MSLLVPTSRLRRWWTYPASPRIRTTPRLRASIATRRKDDASMSAMKIYQRMLYVGLGGTGLQIGTQLERALRSELCGPSGTELITELNFPRPMEPFQLPKCIQFVYLDFDESERKAARKASSERVGDHIASETT